MTAPSSPATSSLLEHCKANPPTYVFVQGWQLLALAVSLFVPKNTKLLWFLKLHLKRNIDNKYANDKYSDVINIFEKLFSISLGLNVESMLHTVNVRWNEPY